MARAWIQDGLRHAKERANAIRRLEAERQRQDQLIEEAGPGLMRALIAELQTALDEYRRASDTPDTNIEFSALPREGFVVARNEAPRVVLQCRPDYGNHTLSCSLAHAGTRTTETVESPFNLHFIVDEAEAVRICDNARTYRHLDELVELLLTPVLFPGPEEIHNPTPAARRPG